MPYESMPLAAKPQPIANVRELLAINTVHLNMAGASRRAIRNFYVNVLGLEAVNFTEDSIEFRLGLRRIIVGPANPQIPFTRLGLSVTGFGDLLKRLAAGRHTYEVLHFDGGLSRAALLQDPAGNWIHLLETRAF